MTAAHNTTELVHSELLNNITARAIFYSCISEGKTIPEIAKTWGYRTSTYFYQKSQRDLINKMLKANLISKTESKGQEIYFSNYDAIVTRENLDRFFLKTNAKIENEAIVEEFDYEVSEAQLEDALFKEFCLSKKPNLKSRLEKIRFKVEETFSFHRLWNNDVFKKTFLSVSCLSKTLQREQLFTEPLELLHSITINVCYDIYEVKEKTNVSYLFSPYRYIPPQAVLSCLLKMTKEFDEQTLWTFVESFQQVYTLMEKKLRAESAEEAGSYYTKKFIKFLSSIGESRWNQQMDQLEMIHAEIGKLQERLQELTGLKETTKDPSQRQKIETEWLELQAQLKNLKMHEEGLEALVQ